MTKNSGVPSFDGGPQPGDRWAQEWAQEWERNREADLSRQNPDLLALALESIAARPDDWTVPAGESYTHMGLALSDAPCGHSCDPRGGCSGRYHRVIGEWYPNDDDTAPAYSFSPSLIPGESKDEQAARLAKERRKRGNPVSRRIDLLTWMYEQVKGRDPDVGVFCAAKVKRGLCWERIADVWHTDRGYYFSGQMVPFKEAIPTHLGSAQEAQRLGEEDFLRAELAWMDMLDSEPDLVPVFGTLNKPRPGDPRPGWLVFGCHSHFDAAIDYATMHEWVVDARRSGKGVAFDCSLRMLGTIDWSASER